VLSGSSYSGCANRIAALEVFEERAEPDTYVSGGMK